MRSLTLLLAIFTVGGFGTLCRYGITKLTAASAFPWGTFLANMIGCFLFGVLAELLSANRLPSEWKPILLTGFLGGFTTFSAFAFENQRFIESKQWTLLAVNLIVQNGLGITAVVAGMGLVATKTAS
jgi:CrcB protein